MALPNYRLGKDGGLQNLYKIAPHRQYKKSKILIHEGEEVSDFFFIKTGYILVYTITDGGEQRTLLILKPHDVFPLLKDPETRPYVSLYFYEALSDVKLGVVPQNTLLAYLKNNRKAAWSLLRYVSEFSSILANRLAQLEGKKAEDKVKNLLSYLITVCGREIKPNTYLLTLKFTRQMIANLVSLTRETASVELKKLKAQGIITPRGPYFVVNAKHLILL